MTPRERTLLTLFVTLLGGFVVYWGWTQVDEALERRADRVSSLEREIRRMKRTKTRGLLAAKSLKTYRHRSLPSESYLANSNYRAWLHEWLERADVTSHDVAFQTRQVVRGKDRSRPHWYDMYTFTVTCRLRLDQWVQLMYEFYHVDHLHRIKQMTLRPIREGELALAMEIEAVAVAGVARSKPLPKSMSQRLAFASLEQYMRRILTRNPYGPPNQPPRFAGSDTDRIYLGQTATVRFSADDPEKKPVRFHLLSELPGEVEFDESSGTLRWRPTEKGEFDVKVAAEDTGLPPQRVERTIKLVVQDPPPKEPPPPGFDVARFTFLTAVVMVNGRPEAWLYNRPEGRMLKLHTGDTLEVGSFRGKVGRIEAESMEIHTGQQIVRIGLGSHLRAGVKVGDHVAEKPH